MTTASLPDAAPVQERGIGRFLLKGGLLAVAILVSGILISRYDTGATDDNYLAAVLEKDRLIRTTPSPKMILVGGSNLAFGIDSRMMRDSLNVSQFAPNVGVIAPKIPMSSPISRHA